jgi:hypothetical protein
MKRISSFILGYSRDHKGNVTNYHRIGIANTIHRSSGSGCNTDQFISVIYETE